MNMDELSELIRTGALDMPGKADGYAVLVSLTRTDWSALGNFFLGLFLLGYSLLKAGLPARGRGKWRLPGLHVCGVAIYYSLMVAMSAASVWLGRNLPLLDFWFSLTMFSRYRMENISRPLGRAAARAFTFVVPILVVVNVPARLLVRPLSPHNFADWLPADLHHLRHFCQPSRYPLDL